MTGNRARGQALVEVALALPILLVLLAGTYAAARTAFLSSRAESASFAMALRAGRGLPGIEPELSRSVLPERDAVEIRPGRENDSRLLSAPFPTIAGRTTAALKVRKTWGEVGNPQWLAKANLFRKTELSADCWGRESSSGKRIERWVRGVIVLGAVP